MNWRSENNYGVYCAVTRKSSSTGRGARRSTVKYLKMLRLTIEMRRAIISIGCWNKDEPVETGCQGWVFEIVKCGTLDKTKLSLLTFTFMQAFVPGYLLNNEGAIILISRGT